MIKLTKHQPNAREVVIRIDGGLTAESLKECHELLGVGPVAHAVTVDLSGLTSLDAEGCGCLIGLRERGCRLIGASLYIKKLLEETKE